LAGCDDAEETVADFYERALDHVDARDFDSAIIELRNALQQDPENAEVRALLGRVFLELGRGEDAANQLMRARRLGLDDPELLPDLTRAWLIAEEAETVLEEVPPQPEGDPAIAARLIASRGMALLDLGREEDAERAFRRALERQEIAEAYSGLARVAARREDLEATARHVEAGLAIDDDHAGLLMDRGNLRLARGETDLALEDFRAAMEREPFNAIAIYGVARALVVAGEFEQAATIIERLENVAEGSPSILLLNAWISLNQGELDRAFQLGQEVLDIDSDNLVARYIVGAASFGMETYQRAIQHLSIYLSAAPRDMGARRLLAAAQVRVGDVDAAYFTLADAAARENLSPEDLAGLSTLSLIRGQREESVVLIEEAIVESPDDAGLRTRLGMLRMREGDAESAAAEFRRAAEDSPEVMASSINLVLAELARGDAQAALDEASAFQENFPDASHGYTLAALAHMAMGNRDEARAALEQALEIDPGDINAARNLAAFAAREENWEDARSTLEAALEENPGNADLLVRLAQMETSAGDPQAGLARLEEAAEHNPADPEVATYLARVYLMIGRPDAAFDTIETPLRRNPSNPAVLEVAARSQLDAGNLEQAIDLYRALLAVAPDSYSAHRYLSAAYEAVGDLDLALEHIEEAIERNESDSTNKYSRVRILIAAGEGEEARRALDDLEAEFPEDPDIWRMRGNLATSEGKVEEAVEHYAQALDMRETNFDLLHMASALEAVGRSEEAERLLLDWLDRYPDDALTLGSLGDFYLGRERFEEAVDAYRRAIELQPDDLGSHNNLAVVLEELGEVEAALEHAEIAMDLAPREPQILDTVASVRLAAGDVLQAITLFEQAAALAPDDGQIAFHLAQAYLANGEVDAAAGLLRQVLVQDTVFPDRDEARQLLEDLEQ
jgi:putative PEP-CTERM system TPR-repeat lipoprotein